MSIFWIGTVLFTDFVLMPGLARMSTPAVDRPCASTSPEAAAAEIARLKGLVMGELAGFVLVFTLMIVMHFAQAPVIPARRRRGRRQPTDDWDRERIGTDRDRRGER